jgi:hypothetical protein
MAISRLTLMERIRRFLRSIETRGIEPSRWEGYCTKQALVALNDGNIEEAEGHMHLAKTPPELRTSTILVGFSPESRSPTLAELQAELERIAANGTAAPRAP